MRNCEFVSESGEKCRKRARVIIGFKQPFGTQCGPMGDTPVFIEGVTYRCPLHAVVREETRRRDLTALDR
jgi:hypothetical protein